MTELHRETVSAPLWLLLVELMVMPELKKFRLVGGTALALHLGHRRSEDIDLFTDEPFDSNVIGDSLRLSDQRICECSVSGHRDDIKIDVMAHRYAWIDPAEEWEGIRLASIRDIAAMKLNAIANRGSKKDFWDIAVLLDRWTLDDVMSWYRIRYSHMDDWQVVRSLTYFDDAEEEPDPVSLTALTWPDVKERIQNTCRLQD